MVNHRKGILTALLILGISLSLGMVEKNNYTYQTDEKSFPNPLMGFALRAEDEEAVGDNMLVYVDVTFRELEPEEGVFDFEGIREENNLAKWRAEGRKVVFRFFCDEPGLEKHLDIPDWLYQKTEDGSFYDTSYGKGYAPNYENKVFIAAHEKAIRALGEEFGEDSFFCYIELGSLGHWGEWHVNYGEGVERFPGEKTALLYIKPYIEAFPKAKLLMRRPFRAVTDYRMGVYNDMTGEPNDTKEWLEWIKKGGTYDGPKKTYSLKAYPEIWNDSPVGGEFTSSISMDNMLTTNLKRTLSLLRQSHMTFIGPKSPTANTEALDYPDAYKAVQKAIGYRYGVTESSETYFKLFGSLSLSLTFKNSGAAPMYFPWKAYTYLYNTEGEVIQKQELDLDLTALTQNCTKTVEVTFHDTILKKQKLRVGVGIEDPDTQMAAVRLAMETERDGYIYKLGK